MKTRVAPHILEATASLLSIHPEITNAELLQRLTAQLGEAEMRSILVTRFQRQVRDPAIRLLQDRMKNGDPQRPAPSAEAMPARPRRRGERGEEGRRTGGRRRDEDERRPAKEPDTLRRIDEAVERAFRLGAEAGSLQEIIEAYRALEDLRLEVRRVIRGGR